MGKFDGMLLVSDYDNTLRFTRDALDLGGVAPDLPESNRTALRHWMAEGGRFGVATGRSLAAFRANAPGVPFNAPAVLDNGGTIYDFTTGKYLYETQLTHKALGRISQVLERFTGVSSEIYIPGDTVLTVRPTDWMDRHAQLTGAKYKILDRLGEDTVTEPILKALFVGDHAELEEIRLYMEAQGWNGDWELVYSRFNLLEMTAPGANKGYTARKLQELCGCHTLIAIGDGTNDLSMLLEADAAFTPANAEEEVLEAAANGRIHVVCDCKLGAVAEAIAYIEDHLPQ